METMYDFLALLLFIATAGLYLVRRPYEDPPLRPYLVMALVGIVGNWLGNQGGGTAAFTLMVAGSFYALHIASQPFHEPSAKSPRL